jgi:deoxyribodipyrimidine photo-lyase
MVDNDKDETSLMSTIWWIRRDLRLNDNQALAAAAASGGPVTPVFILDPNLLGSAYVGEKRVAFLFASLRALERDLVKSGNRLIIRSGDPLEVLPLLLSELEADEIHAEEDFSPYARRRDSELSKRLPLKLHPGLTVFPPGMIEKKSGGPYTVYTPFRRAWEGLSPPTIGSLLPVPARLEPVINVEGEQIPPSPEWSGETEFPAGEQAARERLDAFTSGQNPPVYTYNDLRNRVDRDATSKLSPYLRFGMISLREAVIKAIKARETAPNTNARKGAQTWLQELIWREFFINILYHFPNVRGNSFREDYRNIRWRNDEVEFRAWKEGRTGYPIVDAAMRQLLHTGWMHNRARMVVASFLVKDLLIDWRWGERWFMQQLIDGDPAANNGGWQWSAGTGTDAAPYFRIFNPILQGQKHDPEAVYIRRWVPELRVLPEEYLHTPWEMPEAVQTEVGIKLGEDYPRPIVDHQDARERTLRIYSQARGE